jgi:GPH family glycoside/pentoside/hexuronide:cation symporter
MITAWHGTRHAPVTRRTSTQLPWRSQVRSFMGNRPFLTIMLVKALQLIGVYANQTALFFMVVEVLQRSSADIAYIGLPSVFVSILVTPLLLRYARRFGKRVAYMTAALFAGASYASWIFATPDEPQSMLVLRGVLVGVGFSGNVLFAMSMIADAIEWDTIRTGLHREGMFTAVFSFVEKFAGAIGPTIVGVALSWAGFSATSEVTPESYATLRQATLIGVSYFPAACATLSVIVLCFYSLSENRLASARQAADAGGIRESQL